jgi:hypothetical protein
MESKQMLADIEKHLALVAKQVVRDGQSPLLPQFS